MLEHNRFPLAEGFKSMLIFLLAVSALYLGTKAFMPYGTGGEESVVDLLPQVTADSLGRVGVSGPVRMAVVNEMGRFGLQYDDTAVDAMFGDLGDLLGEALGSAGAAAPVDRSIWEEALMSRGVYYDFPGVVSLPLLSAWLGEEETKAEAYASCLLLAAGEEDAAARLYYVDAGDGGYYACSTSVQFRQRLDEYVPNEAIFAFQEPERYSGLDPDTLILPGVPAPAIYKSTAGVDVQDDGELESLLDGLSFSPQPNAIYPAANGWNVREAEDSLRLLRSGNVYYEAGDGSDRYSIPHDATDREAVELTGEVVRRAMTPYCGEARIYLDEIGRTEKGWILTYCYALSGAEVKVGQEGWCARFVIEGGQIREYVLKLRDYEKTDTAAVLLPEYQAMYAMEAMDAVGRKLLLSYYDSGAGTVSPSWIAR